MGDYKLKRMFLDQSAPGRPGTEIKPKALVIHWTANTDRGADAVANRSYFNNSGEAVSAHYVVDEYQVVQCLPEREMAYHVGAQHYEPRALEMLSSYPNDCTIGVEMCVNRDGDFAKTYRNTVALAGDITSRYGWGISSLWRHYDITGTHCPKYFVEDAIARRYGFESAVSGWEKFKKDVVKGGNGVGKFTDLEGHWAQAMVERAHQLGLVSGRTEDKFVPDGYVTRAEAVVLLMRLYDLLKKE